MYLYYAYASGVYVENLTPYSVRVPHSASACATITPFLPKWFCGSPIPYNTKEAFSPAARKKRWKRRNAVEGPALQKKGGRGNENPLI